MQTDLSIPSLGDKFIDLRNALPGDCFNWNWVRPLDQVNYLAIHHSAAFDTESPEEIANYHINTNGWGGIGYHFLIAKDGRVFYVGDIQTARANVANLNEQVLGICLIGNFTEGRIPTIEQLDSAHKLCEFFINYQDLINVTSWDKLRGHKELPNQLTNCPGDDWTSWRIKIVEGVDLNTENKVVEDNADILKSQVDSLQASLASVNQQNIFLQETLQERQEEISTLKETLEEQQTLPDESEQVEHVDNTLTIADLVINLYKFVFLPRKVESVA